MWTPGDTLVIDWGVENGAHVFCAVLAWSRFRFVRFAADEKAPTAMGLGRGRGNQTSQNRIGPLASITSWKTVGGALWLQPTATTDTVY